MLEIVVVPKWLEQTLQTEGKMLSVVLNPQQFLSTLSVSDIQKYLTLNSNNGVRIVLNNDIIDTFGNVTFRPEFVDVKENLGIEYYEYITPDDPKQASLKKVEYLFGPLSEGMGTDIFYRVLTLDPDSIAIIPEDSNEGNLTYNELLEELLIHLKGRVKFEDLAKTSLFKGFLKVL